MVKQYFIKGVTSEWLLKPGMVVYVEQEYEFAINDFIKLNYDEITEWCTNHHLIFLYIPQFYQSCSRKLMEYMTGNNNMPFDSTSIVLKHSLSESSFTQIQGPSFLFSGKKEDGISAFLINEDIEGSINKIFSDYEQDSMSSIEKELFTNSSIRFRIKEDEDTHFRFSLRGKEKVMDDRIKAKVDICWHLSDYINNILEEDEEKVLEEDDEIDMHLVDEARNMVVRLLQKGYSIDTLLALFVPMQELSTIRITKDYRIYLPLYQKDIELPPIQKSIYLLFLKHPEGIYFKELSNYETELYLIYRKLAVRGVNAKHIGTIKDIVNPLSNSINEKCSLIKKRILAILDDSLAKHYYISGGKGEIKKIDINPTMIIWE